MISGPLPPSARPPLHNRAIRKALATLVISLTFLPVAEAEDFTLSNGKKIKDAKVKRAEPDGIVVTTKTGIMKLYFSELSIEVRERFHYDPDKAAAYSAAESLKRPGPRALPSTPPASATVTPNSPLPSAPPSSDITKPVSPNIEQQQDAVPSQGLLLDRSWLSSMQGGSAATADLGRLLSPHVESKANFGPAPSIEIYRGVHYLMDLRAAIERLGLQSRLPSKNKIICPGLPKDSFSYIAFDGIFDGDYNRLNLVADKADQVVSIQLLNESPRRDLNQATRAQAEWYCYNFINYRVKGSNHLRIYHDVKELNGGQLLRIDSILIDPQGTTGPTFTSRGHGRVSPNHFRALESNRWFVPSPLAELILFCVSKTSGHR